MRTSEQNREYMRGYQRRRRGVNTKPNVNIKPVNTAENVNTGPVNTTPNVNILGANVNTKPKNVNILPDVNTRNVNTLADVNTENVNTLSPEWQHIIDFISRPGNLAKVQAICSSLGKYASEVRLGCFGPTAEEIGQVIGVHPPVTRIASAKPLVVSTPDVHELLARASRAGRPDR